MRFECTKCGWVSFPPRTVKVVFHSCLPGRGRRRLSSVPSISEFETSYDRRDEQRTNWFTSKYPIPPKKEKK